MADILVLTDSQEATLGIEPVDAAGNAAAVEGVEWSCSASDILVLTPSADGLSCLISTTGKVGDAQVSVSADALVGTGESRITNVLHVSVRGGMAVAFAVKAGAITERKPVVPAPEPTPVVPAPEPTPVVPAPEPTPFVPAPTEPTA